MSRMVQFKTALYFIVLLAISTSLRAQNDDALVHQRWAEARTAHFIVYSSGPAREIAKIAARLEQFHQAYGLLAGADAVVSPPVTVIVFPDHAAMKPYLPLYNGKPSTIAGFFHHGANEDMIVLSLHGTNEVSLQTIFHEYTHVLFRHNQNIWPVWLNEGMAEIYSTFQAFGRTARIAQPIEEHLDVLQHADLMPLSELLNVKHDSPQYNESDRQGIFYAQSWLLAQFLMNGDNPAYKSRFSRYTALLREGQPPDTALTRALGAPLPAIEAELRRYLERSDFQPLDYVFNVNLSAPQQMTSRPIGYAETCFRLGDELLQIARPDDAEPFFAEAKKIAPDSPLSFEGLGLLAAARKDHAAAAQLLKQSLDHGSTDFLVHYLYAEERLAATGDSEGRFRRVDKSLASEIRAELSQSVRLMPNFGPAHQLLGFFELIQGDDYGAAAEHLQRAIQLEPERQHYLIYLAEAQIEGRDPDAARRTLAPLTLPNADAKLRDRAKEILGQLDNKAGP
jgi:tetratricopeptide (TPR) repeat protein